MPIGRSLSNPSRPCSPLCSREWKDSSTTPSHACGHSPWTSMMRWVIVSPHFRVRVSPHFRVRVWDSSHRGFVCGRMVLSSPVSLHLFTLSGTHSFFPLSFLTITFSCHTLVCISFSTSAFRSLSPLFVLPHLSLFPSLSLSLLPSSPSSCSQLPSFAPPCSPFPQACSNSC